MSKIKVQRLIVSRTFSGVSLGVYFPMIYNISYIQDDNKYNTGCKNCKEMMGCVNRATGLWMPLKKYGKLGKD